MSHVHDIIVKIQTTLKIYSIKDADPTKFVQNDDPALALTLFMARSTALPYAELSKILYQWVSQKPF